jgi:phosphatidylethanolamine-binding protein (PEBP) family uncharacterized protein
MHNRIIACIAAVFSVATTAALAGDLKVVFEKSGKGGAGPEPEPGAFLVEGTCRNARLCADDDGPGCAGRSFRAEQGGNHHRQGGAAHGIHAWVLVDIPASLTSLAEGTDGDGLQTGGLPLERTDHGRRGQNGFAAFLKDGPRGGYMGACPPFNDARIHRYRVTVYALDTDRLNLPDVFTRADLLAAAKGHVVSSGWAELIYTINAKASE